MKRTALTRRTPLRSKRPAHAMPERPYRKPTGKVTEASVGGHVGTATVKPVRVVDEAYLAWVRLQPCIVTGRMTSENERVDPAHINTVGSGGSDRRALPLLHTLHIFGQHQRGFKTFAKEHGLDYEALIAEHNARYERLHDNGAS